MMPQMPKSATPPARPGGPKADTLLAQVTALMMNAQRYEMRAAVFVAMGDINQATEAMYGSDHYAEQAFALLAQPTNDSQPPLRYRTREEALAAEFPDAVELRKANPEFPDVTEDPSEVDVVVNSDGELLSKVGEQDV